MPQDLLLEVGTEEMPARFLEPVLAQLAGNAAKAFAAQHLEYEKIAVYATCRRLVLYVTSLNEYQGDWVEEVKGPPARVAYDSRGQPARAAVGFARAQGVGLEQLVVKSTPAGDYVYALKRYRGKPSLSILPDILPDLITSLTFPKAMRWGESSLRFARPIRWIVALYGEQVVSFALEKLVADRITRGHRLLSPGQIILPAANRYFQVMEQNYVIVDQDRRRAVIWKQVQQLAASLGGRVEEDPGLLDQVTYLVEYPQVLGGSFSVEFLRLPEEVLVTTMREHQRYFPVHDPEKRLLPKFIAVHNGSNAYQETIRAGNERVLSARLADAAFFYQEDVKEPLTVKVDKLKRVIFQEELGSVYEKVDRLQDLVNYLARVLGFSKVLTSNAVRAAYLAKADLVTNMVAEFPELQGIMGSYYAAYHGEKPEVCQGIREHYLPRFSGDVLPTSPVGLVISLADKLDTVVGYFAVGIQPTGSQDPYGLRRQALGICALILGKELRVSLRDLITQAYGQYVARAQMKLSLTEVCRELGEFFRQRLENIMEEKGIPYDVVAAVFAAGWDDFVDAYRRAQTLLLFRGEPWFNPLYTAFTRVRNLSKGVKPAPVRPELFEDAVEHNLYRTFLRLKEEADRALKSGDYLGAMRTLSALGEPVDAFFDGVMVMVENAQIRNNRLALLEKIASYIASIADLSYLVVS